MTRNGAQSDDVTSEDLEVPEQQAEHVTGGVIAIIQPSASAGTDSLPYPEQSSRLGAIKRS
jgi:hypothetical protein